jgi:tetratricopeptide (TPR) repeat protein
MVRTKGFIVITLMLTLCVSGCQWFSRSSAKPYEEISPTIDEQKAALQKQIERKYENPEAHYQLGRLYHADGLFERAEFQYRVALGFDPVHYKAQGGIVKALKDKGDQAASKMTADVYMSQASVSAESSLLLGRAFQREGLDDYALACYQQAQNLAPNSAVVFRQIGYYYLNKGDQVRAEENLRRSFQLDPYQPEVAETLGRMGVMVQIPKKPARSDNFLKNLLKKEEAQE